MPLYHFSEEAGIELFVPRPPLVLAPRQPGREWLNGPLVWAIDGAHAFLYLFPRDCPRIVAWATTATSDADRSTWLGNARAVAVVEAGWLGRIASVTVFRYRLPAETFEGLGDAGMYISRVATRPEVVDELTDMPGLLASEGVDLRPQSDLAQFRGLWETSLHVSGIRLRNAVGWAAR